MKYKSKLLEEVRVWVERDIYFESELSIEQLKKLSASELDILVCEYGDYNYMWETEKEIQIELPDVQEFEEI